MKRTILTTVLIIVAAAVASAQEFRPIPNPPVSKSFAETLQATGNFKTFLSLLGESGAQDNVFRSTLIKLGITPLDGKTNRTKVSPGGEPRYQTLFVPTDAAFGRLPQGALEALKKDPAGLRAFLLAHMVAGKVMIADVLTPIGDGTSKTFKELKSRQGQVLGFQCNGHTGMHLPWINGKARVGKFQDVMASDYLIVIHEIDAVLMAGSV